MRRILKRKRDEKLRDAATLIQRYCKGHLVAKHYIHIIGDASIDKSLFSFRVMKNEIGRQLANLLYFYWRVYQRTQERKRKEEAERKKKAKGKKKKKGGGVQRRDSVMSTKSNFTVSKSHQQSFGNKSNASSTLKVPAVKNVDRRASVMPTMKGVANPLQIADDNPKLQSAKKLTTEAVSSSKILDESDEP